MCDLGQDNISFKIDKIWDEYDIPMYFYSVYCNSNRIGCLTYSVLTVDNMSKIKSSYDLNNKDDKEDMFVFFSELLKCSEHEYTEDVLDFVENNYNPKNKYIYINKLDISNYRGMDLGKLIMGKIEAKFNDCHIVLHPAPVCFLLDRVDSDEFSLDIEETRKFYSKYGYNSFGKLMFKYINF